ncbi:protein lin-28 homolog A-like [Salvelinus namaycush]|uniref:Protein lin-28 homolog A-like n=1 Tax=Salvelinus namaycush TaxID=8040 RepID=A0A8U0PYX4_SALNM|nr:protein lin-28 homolog A-like [Salvelinus namaycush]
MSGGVGKGGDRGEEPGSLLSGQQQSMHGAGHCKWFNVRMGFGFISMTSRGGTPVDPPMDVFVHQSKLHMEGFRSLREGEPLEFTFQWSPRGLESVQVTGPGRGPCSGSERRQKPKPPAPPQRWKPQGDRCYNCGGLDHHAKECGLPPQPKKCHYCQSATHMVAHCPHRPPGPLSPATATQGRRTTVDQYPGTFTTTSYSPSPRQGNRHSQPSQDSSSPLSKSSSKSSSSPEDPAQIQRRSGVHHRWKQS